MGEQILFEREHERGVPLRNRYFTAINSSSVRSVADRHRLAATITNTADDLSGGINIDDLEQP